MSSTDILTTTFSSTTGIVDHVASGITGWTLCSLNPRRACAARVTLCVVCLSVTALAATAFFSACNEWHLRNYYRLFLDLSSWTFEKTFRSKVMA